MTTAEIIIWVVLGLFLVFGLLPTMMMAGVLYTVLLVRTKPEKWNRSCSIPDDAEYVRMFDIGMEWAQTWAAHKQEVAIQNGRFRLCGEYFDFGFDRAVIIIPGRMESCLYSYFFAEPYRRSGWNVLVIDNRAHGNSDGKISSLGFREYRDILAWGRFLKEEKGNRAVFLHGICIGASTALFALTAKNCPDYMVGMAGEGMYATFCDSIKKHMEEGKHPTFPFVAELMLYIRLISGANVVTDGPVRRIRRMKKPILFLHSREDAYSVPEKAEELYAACEAPKQLVWFEHGAHSRIRINNMEEYDCAIASFLSNVDIK